MSSGSDASNLDYANKVPNGGLDTSNSQVNPLNQHNPAWLSNSVRPAGPHQVEGSTTSYNAVRGIIGGSRGRGRGKRRTRKNITRRVRMIGRQYKKSRGNNKTRSRRRTIKHFLRGGEIDKLINPSSSQL